MKWLKKYFLPITIFVLLTFVLFNFLRKEGESSENISGISMAKISKIKIEKTLIDIGKIERNGLAEARFKIINNGSKPFIITDVHVDCHCTVADWSKEPVPPEDSTFIIVRYDSSQPGFFLKKVTVFSNAINSPTLLVLRGEITLEKGIVIH